jgi:hypothetical protein
MLSGEEKREVQKMINQAVNNLHFNVLDPRLKELEKKVKALSAPNHKVRDRKTQVTKIAS